jgi:hypothetical protein
VTESAGSAESNRDSARKPGAFAFAATAQDSYIRIRSGGAFGVWPRRSETRSVSADFVCSHARRK